MLDRLNIPSGMDALLPTRGLPGRTVVTPHKSSKRHAQIVLMGAAMTRSASSKARGPVCSTTLARKPSPTATYIDATYIAAAHLALAAI